MQTTSVDIEQIIRVVMQRLAAAGDLAEGVAKITAPALPAGDLVLSDRLVTLKQIEGQLEGKQRVRVSLRAVVTPAVIDLLRQKKIALLRDEVNSQAARGVGQSEIPRPLAATATASKSEPSVLPLAPVLVSGSAVWFGSLFKHLCSKQAVVQEAEDTAVLQRVSEHLQRGGQRAVWVTRQPFAAALAAGRVAHVDAVQLPSLRELSAALEQARPHLMIVDANQWTVAAIGNLVRTLAKKA